jgi:hypothetical protein
MKSSSISRAGSQLRLGYFLAALSISWSCTVPARAGLTFQLELDHNSDAYYLSFPMLSTNSNSANPPETGYFVWSHSSTINSGTTAELDPDGTASFNGGFFPDYASLIMELTNSWTLMVTNLTSTNTYTFYVSYFASNALPVVAVTFPTDGSTTVPSQPTFTWQGPANYDSLFVQVADGSGFFQSESPPVAQTSWPSPAVLYPGTNYTFLVSYTRDATASIVASTPLDISSQPFPGWASTCTLNTASSSGFTVTNAPPPPPPSPGTWTITGGMTAIRAVHTLTLLSNGKVLASAGEGAGFFSVATAELYDPSIGMWAMTGSLHADRYGHTANLLGNGKVLVAGGIQSFSSFGNVSSTELYNPTNGTWATNASMTTSRYGHTATLLGNGKVLAAGGQAHDSNGYATLASAELYDPNLGAWTLTGPMPNAHEFHTATLLTNGWVLVAGGEDTNGTPMAGAELYNPATGLWTNTGSLLTKRKSQAAALLPDGKVLVAGGVDTGFNPLASAELYDPVLGIWAATGSMSTSRQAPTATLLRNGLVLVTGGTGNSGVLSSAELYDPARGMWTAAATMHNQRQQFPATLLSSGKVLVAGGFFGGSLTNAELYTSTASVVVPIILTGATVLLNGAFRFDFTNTPGASFTALSTTSLSLPLTNWTVLGSPTNVALGLFQFTDLQATNSPRRFYGIRSP